MDVKRGTLTVVTDTGSAGSAAFNAGSYNFQSISLGNLPEDLSGMRWVVELWREGVLIATVCTDSPNATGNAQVQLPDFSRQYGLGIWWANLVPPSDFVVGDTWRVYGWDDGTTIESPDYPVDRS